MIKMVYVAETISTAATGDNFDVAISYDIEEARKELDRDYRRTSERDKRNRLYCISGYMIDVEDDNTSASDAYNDWVLEHMDFNPDFYEEYKDYEKNYTIKPEYYDAWGATDDNCTVTLADIERFSDEWEMSIDELMEQVEA